MGNDRVTESDRERYAHARARGKKRAEHPSAVVEARYDPESDVIALTFGGGGQMAIPRNAVPGLERATSTSVASIVVSPSGDALSWPPLDLHVHVSGLVERVFGTRLLAAASGRRGGRRKSKAKAAAAKANGAMGGRPRKRRSAVS